MSRNALPTVLFVAASTTLLASAAQEAIFRANIELVTVDATVVGRDGSLIADLGPGDFSLQVDGQRRNLVSVQLVTARAATEPASAPARWHFSSNQETESGRRIVVAVDEAHIRRLEGRAATDAAAAFIDRLDPTNRVAVTGLSRLAAITFTNDRTMLKRRLGSLVGQADPVFVQFNIGLSEAIEVADGSRTRLADVVLRECGRALTDYTSLARAADDAGGRDACPEQVEQEARAIAQQARTQAGISLNAIGALIDALKAIDGPKTVVLLSEGMALDPRLTDLAELSAAAQEAQVAIYALQLERPLFEAAQDRASPTFLRDTDLGSAGLARLTGATRGAVFRLVGSDPQPFNRIARELSGHYLLAFEAADSDHDGRVHRVRVTLTKGGGVLRARSEFRLRGPAPTTRTREQDIVALLRTTRASTELPVRVATYTYGEPSSNALRLVVSTEADAASGPASLVQIGYVLTDVNGVIAASGTQASEQGRQAFSVMVATGGVYTLRVAGIDGLNRKGLVQRPFVARLDSLGGIRLSNLILAPASDPSTALHPIVDRVSSTHLTAYVELYGDNVTPLEDVRVTFEVVADAAGTPVVAVEADRIRGDSRWKVARGDLALGDLPKGRYLARARIDLPRQPLGEVVRPFTYAP